MLEKMLWSSAISLLIYLFVVCFINYLEKNKDREE